MTNDTEIMAYKREEPFNTAVSYDPELTLALSSLTTVIAG